MYNYHSPPQTPKKKKNNMFQLYQRMHAPCIEEVREAQENKDKRIKETTAESINALKCKLSFEIPQQQEKNLESFMKPLSNSSSFNSINFDQQFQSYKKNENDYCVQLNMSEFEDSDSEDDYDVYEDYMLNFQNNGQQNQNQNLGYQGSIQPITFHHYDNSYYAKSIHFNEDYSISTAHDSHSLSQYGQQNFKDITNNYMNFEQDSNSNQNMNAKNNQSTIFDQSFNQNYNVF